MLRGFGAKDGGREGGREKGQEEEETRGIANGWGTLIAVQNGM